MYPRRQVIQSIFKRNFTSYFSGVLGYLFIVVFVVLGGALAFNARFFTANEPNLDQLTTWYPLLLLLFIGQIGGLLGLGELLERLSLQEQFRDFGMGVVSLTSCGK